MLLLLLLLLLQALLQCRATTQANGPDRIAAALAEIKVAKRS